MVPVEVAKSDKTENSSRESIPDVAVIELEEELQEPQRSEQQEPQQEPQQSQQQPLVIDECRSEKGQQSQPQDPDLGESLSLAREPSGPHC